MYFYGHEEKLLEVEAIMHVDNTQTEQIIVQLKIQQ